MKEISHALAHDGYVGGWFNKIYAYERRNTAN